MPYSRARAATLTMEKVFLRAWYPTTRTQTVFPFANADVAFQLPHDAYLPACDKRMPLPCDDDLHQHTTYRISLSLLLSYQTYPKAARLASLLPPSPLHTPPASAAPLTRKLPTMCLVPRRCQKKRHSLGGCWLSSPPSQVVLHYIYSTSVEHEHSGTVTKV